MHDSLVHANPQSADDARTHGSSTSSHVQGACCIATRTIVGTALRIDRRWTPRTILIAGIRTRCAALEVGKGSPDLNRAGTARDIDRRDTVPAASVPADTGRRAVAPADTGRRRLPRRILAAGRLRRRILAGRRLPRRILAGRRLPRRILAGRWLPRRILPGRRLRWPVPAGDLRFLRIVFTHRDLLACQSLTFRAGSRRPVTVLEPNVVERNRGASSCCTRRFGTCRCA